MTEAKPYPKTQQLARAERRYRRKVASPKQWAAFKAQKGRVCRVCENLMGHSLHHVVPRDFGGDDLAENLAPVCLDCHVRLHLRDAQTCATFCASLSDAEYAYAVEKVGENVWERVYGIEYGR